MCTMDCPGKSRISKCGGKNALSIYQYDGAPKNIPDKSKYVGCFADDPSDRALTVKSKSDGSNMTYQV